MTKEQKAAAIALLANVWEVDAIQLAIVYRKAYDEKIDTYEFACLLDELLTQGKVKVVRPGAIAAYRYI